MENNGILKSFDLKDDLNPKIWKKNSKGSYILSPKVREKLLEIAYEFIESLKVDVIVSDVHLTGSLVNFNWSQYSDFDLHIIADFNQFPKKSLPLYEELFKLKKTIFNSEQNIKIYGYDVEVFVQDENEKGHSAGIFSLISNDWLEKPKKEKFEVNKTILKKKIDQWTEKIDKVLESAEEEKNLRKSKKIIDNLKTKIKDYRKIGLEKGGEMSYENLVFKYLRRSGHIEKLFSFKKERLDKELSLEEQFAPKESLKSIFSNWFKPKEKVDDPKKADVVDADVQELYDNLDSIDEPLSQQNRGEYSFQKKVESMQIGLVLLGFDLPVYGVDGLYGPETADAVKRFKDENDLNKPDDSDKTDDSDDSGEQEESFSRRNNNLLEVNTYGFDGTKEGGNNGDWDGTMEKTLAIADIARSCWEEFVPDQEFPGITSQKRGTQLTASGRRGDHWVGSADSYAVDLPVPYKNRKELGDKIFSCIMQKWNNGTFSNFKGGSWFSPKVDGYRYQFGWYSDSAHKDHIHVGVRKIDSSIPNTPSMDFGSGESPSGEGSQFTPEAADVMIKKLKEKNITSNDIAPYVDKTKDKPIRFSKGQLAESKEIIDFLVSKGLSVAQASGIAGNLFKESGFKTDAIGDGGTSYGLAQWHNTRWDDLKKFVQDKNYEMNTIKSQMEFLWYELTEKYKTVYENLKKTDDPADAATIFASGYEKPASKNYSDRRRYATNFYNKYTGEDVSYDEPTGSNTDKKRESLPKKILNFISKLEDKIGRKFSDKEIEKEFEQEGDWREDAGGENREARQAIDKLISDAKKKFGDRLSNLGVVSGYRSYDQQVKNFAEKVLDGRSIQNVQQANTIPGFSQHHTGKAFDIFSVETSWWNNNPDIKKWVADNAKRYGFKVTYQGSQPLRIPEPWHLYYTSGQDTETKKSTEKTKPTEKKKSKNFLVYQPENYKGGEAHVLFAGLHSYQNGEVNLNENFYGKGVDPIKGKILVVITHWGTTVDEAKKYVKDNYNATVTSIAGFSKGGMRMWDYVGSRSNMKFVGLIDPSPEGEGSGKSPYINLDFGNNTYMVCNWKNWGQKPPGYVPREVLKWYCDHKDNSDYSGKVFCTDKSSDHSEIFLNFYNKFANKII